MELLQTIVSKICVLVWIYYRFVNWIYQKQAIWELGVPSEIKLLCVLFFH